MYFKTESRKNGIWSRESCELESRKQKKKPKSILSYHPLRSKHISALWKGYDMQPGVPSRR